MKTCGQCHHFLQYVGESNGQCYFFPPIPTKDGANIRPTIKITTKACGHLAEMDADAKPEVKTKDNVPSHGKVIQKDAKPKAPVRVPTPAPPSQPSSRKPVTGPESAPTMAQGYQKITSPTMKQPSQAAT